MADKKKKKVKAPKTPLSQEQKDAKAIQNLLGPDTEGANALTRTFFPEGSLGRVSSGFDANGNRIGENQDILDRARAAMEAYGPGGGARRSAETSGVLSQLKAGVGRSRDVQSALDAAKGYQGRTSEMSDYLASLKAATAGYSSAENQAMLEQAMRGVNDDYANAQRRVQVNAGKMGIRGGVLAALAAKNTTAAARSGARMRQDLFVKNADEKQKRLLDYGGGLSGAERDEAGRRNDYYSLLTNTEANDATRLNNYAGTLSGVEATELGNETATRNQYLQSLSGIRDDELARQTFNLGQNAAERSGQAGTYFSGLEFAANKRNTKKQQKLNRDYFNLAKGQYGGGRRSSGSGTAPDREGYYREVEGLINRS